MASQSAVFTTQTSYPLPPQSFFIPTSWSRYQLSQLVNKALSLQKPVPFDFLLRGDILKTSLAEWCTKNGVGEEETLEIEYIESVLPPQKMADLPHDEWVTSVSCKLEGHFLTAAYDGQLRAFNYAQKQTWSSAIHRAAITSFCIVPSAEEHLVATTSHDLTAQLTRISLDASEETKPLASLHLHTEPVSAIRANSDGSRLLTASWDGLVGLWSTEIPDTDEVPEPSAVEQRKKRRKIEDIRPKRKAPLMLLKSHTGRVSGVVFDQEDNAFSCGFDSTVRTWDLEHGVCTNTIPCSERPFLSLSASSSPSTVLAASTDRTVSQYDARESSPLASVTMTHPSTPSSIAMSPSNSHQVLTGGYDGVARIWDLRSVKTSTPVASFKIWNNDQKILGVDWRVGMVAAGGRGRAGHLESVM
ncbi:Microtubule binding protein [Mycena kentingensis (nom. inval.)]|nr:Microtubule binding protein [Mycena kentingensis (nom. inval.)]